MLFLRLERQFDAFRLEIAPYIGDSATAGSAKVAQTNKSADAEGLALADEKNSCIVIEKGVVIIFSQSHRLAQLWKTNSLHIKGV